MRRRRPGSVPASRAASAGASARMPCIVTPSARANWVMTPSCSGSKPPRNPARPAPIRNVSDGAGSPRARRAGPGAVRRRRAARSSACRPRRWRSCRSAPPCPTSRRTRGRPRPVPSNRVRKTSGDGQAVDAAVPFERGVERLEQVAAGATRAPTFSTSGTRRTFGCPRDELRAARLRDAGREVRGPRGRAAPLNSPSIAWRYSVPILTSAPMSARALTCGMLSS